MFLDRDGVLNEIVYRQGVPGSPRTLAEFSLVKGAALAIGRLKGAGFRVFVVTNQPDIARRKMAPEALSAMTALVAAAIKPDEVLVCPHDDQANCECRKPKPGMLVDIGRRWEVRLRASYIIGDTWRDIEAGKRAGCRTILLVRDYNEGVIADLRVTDLDQAVTYVLGDRSWEESGEEHR